MRKWLYVFACGLFVCLSAFASEESSQQSPKSQIPVAHAQPLTPLESLYAGRVVDAPRQFGYDVFGTRDTPRTGGALPFRVAPPSGAIQDDFRVSFGDSLEISFRGQRNDTGVYVVRPDGTLLMETLPPIPVAGRTLAQIRAALGNATQSLHATQVHVSLASIRQIGVLVVGHVESPGRQNLTVFHTVLDAIAQAGGIVRTGSLRQIRLIRDGRGQVIDLYALLVHGADVPDITLREGDRIVVPPIGSTVGITGAVRRPGIYEILPATRGFSSNALGNASAPEDRLSLESMLTLAGGVLAPGQNRFLWLDVASDGTEKLEEVHAPFTPLFGNGNLLIVARGEEARSGMVEITGATRKTGLHALAQNPALSALIDRPQSLTPQTYPLIGVVERRNMDHLSRDYLSFAPVLLLSGAFDLPLQEGDVVHLFSKEQIMNLENASTDPLPQGSHAPEDTQEDTREDTLSVLDPALVSFLRERSVFVQGAVRRAGAYPVAEGVSLEQVLASAHGLTLEASEEDIEITTRSARNQVDLTRSSAKDTVIHAGDTVRVRQKFPRHEDRSVLVMGEVRSPGRYPVVAGDRLSTLLERAGGLTPQAYPAGAIFSRESERKAEEARFRGAARDLTRAVALRAEQDSTLPAEQIAMAQTLIEDLTRIEAVGRITVEADPAILSVSPELDILLESEDRIFIPKRPLTVRVSGEVLSPAALQFRNNKTAQEYIREAGGYTWHADKRRSFVVFPDGSAYPLQSGSWSHSGVMIPPGATLIIPRDPKPWNALESAERITQILANLALTAVWLDDLQE